MGRGQQRCGENQESMNLGRAGITFVDTTQTFQRFLKSSSSPLSESLPGLVTEFVEPGLRARDHSVRNKTETPILTNWLPRTKENSQPPSLVS